MPDGENQKILRPYFVDDPIAVSADESPANLVPLHARYTRENLGVV
jgi:hypothetical protein